jgi:hypothetical protein
LYSRFRKSPQMIPMYRSATEPRIGVPVQGKKIERKLERKRERSRTAPPAEMHYPEHELAWVGTSLKMDGKSWLRRYL